jgi:AcrR family transcriptional regulator
MPPETARLLALAFDPRVQTADDALSERILDAALALAAASGLRHLTMDDVARRAGVGRMTVYRRFGGRGALVDALAVRECRRCLAAIAAALDPGSPIEERLVDLFLVTMRVIREHPLLERLARVEPEALLSELTRDGSAVFALVREYLVGLIRDAHLEDPELLAELGLRLGASFVLMPETVLPLDDERAVRRMVGALIAPLVRFVQ